MFLIRFGKISGLFLLTFCAGCGAGKQVWKPSAVDVQLNEHINAVRQKFAPDKRTAIFEISAGNKVLAGQTNLPAAKTALLETLQKGRINFIDSIRVLPDPKLQGKHHAIVTVSVANLRAHPAHPSELVTQGTLGMPLTVWKRERGWFLVQTPDKYLAWVDAGAIVLMDSLALSTWKAGEKLFYNKPYGLSFATADQEGATMSDLVYGNIMILRNHVNGFYEVAFPDGRAGFVPATEAVRYKDWASSREPTEENFVRSAKGLLGVPYLWGGTSFKGVDCSGFTKTIFYMNGLVLPRDASQQVNLGEEIDTKNGWQNLRPGDLLFFGSPAQPGKPERVIHVGMWIGGDTEFIQASGKVEISSLDPGARNYDAAEHKRFLRAKRIPPGAALLDLRKEGYL